MQKKVEEQETEDDATRRELGPRGVPGGPDTSKMTKVQEEQTPKSLDPGTQLRELSTRLRIGSPR